MIYLSGINYMAQFSLYVPEVWLVVHVIPAMKSWLNWATHTPAWSP